MTSEAKPLSPWLSPNQLATRELYKLIWKWFPSKLREPVGLKLLLQIIVKLHLGHLGFTFISNCLIFKLPDYTSHISYKRYKLGTVQNRTLKMEGWTQKFCVNWWSGLAEKYLITTSNILGACQQAMPEDIWIHLIISPTPPLGGKSSWLVFLHPFVSPSVHSPFVPFINAQGGQHNLGTCLKSHSSYVAGAGLTPRSARYQSACLSPLAKSQEHSCYFSCSFSQASQVGVGVRRRELLPLQLHRFSYS